MTTLYRDDLTGDTYESEVEMEGFGIIAHGQLWETFEVHETTTQENPDQVAEALRRLADKWEERYKKQLQVADGTTQQLAGGGGQDDEQPSEPDSEGGSDEQ